MFEHGKLLFDGETFEGKRHGYGIHHLEEYTYEGEFFMNTFHGKGKKIQLCYLFLHVILREC